MWAIVGTDELSMLERTRTVAGIVIAQEFDRDALAWIFDAWQQLHFISGMRWHVAVPCKPGPAGRRPSRETFDVELSDRLREMYGIARAETPVLVLDNFIEEQRQLYIRIGATEADRKRLFTQMAEYIDERTRGAGHDHRPDPAWRRDLTDGLYNHLQAHRLGAAAIGFAPRAISTAARLMRRGV